MISDDHTLIWEAFTHKHAPVVNGNKYSDKFSMLTENQIEIIAMASQNEEEKNAASAWLGKMQSTPAVLLSD